MIKTRNKGDENVMIIKKILFSAQKTTILHGSTAQRKKNTAHPLFLS